MSIPSAFTKQQLWKGLQKISYRIQVLELYPESLPFHIVGYTPLLE